MRTWRAPVLRSDLIVTPTSGREGPAFVVKDPVTDRFFRLREPELWIARRLGRQPPEALRREAEARFGQALGADALAAFAARLAELDLLDGTQPSGARRQPRVRGGVLHARARLANPDRVFGRLAELLGVVYTSPFVVVSAALASAAVGVTAARYPQIGDDLRWFASPRGAALLWIAYVLGAVVHEAAHGVTCRRFGGRVREAGILFLYFMPGLYVNVSDAWLFPERWKRLWVSAAGTYLDVLVWAGGTLLWATLPSGGPVAEGALAVAVSSGLRATVNIHPLLKLDGYYALSDALEIPNLRARSFAYLRARLGTLGRSRSLASRPTRRDRWIYVSYGVLAGVYSGYVLLAVGVSLGPILPGPPWVGLVLIALLLGLPILHRPWFKRVTGRR